METDWDSWWDMLSVSCWVLQSDQNYREDIDHQH